MYFFSFFVLFLLIFFVLNIDLFIYYLTLLSYFSLFFMVQGCLALSALLLSWLCIVASLSVSCCCRFCFRLAGVTLGSLCSPGHSPAPYLAWSAWGLCRCMFRSFCFYLSDFCFYHLSGLYFLALEFSAYFLFYQLFSFLFFVSLTPFY